MTCTIVFGRQCEENVLTKSIDNLYMANDVSILGLDWTCDSTVVLLSLSETNVWSNGTNFWTYVVSNCGEMVSI